MHKRVLVRQKYGDSGSGTASTKSYIKAYILSQLGEQPVMSLSHNIGNKLYTLLESKRNPDKKRYASVRYNERVKVYVSYHVFRRRGCNLNETNIKHFNAYIESKIKQHFYFLMDSLVDILPSFEANLPTVRKHLGIEEKSWSYESMKKDYYRHRKKSGKAMLYRKNPKEGAF